MSAVKDFDSVRKEREAARVAVMGSREIILGGKSFTYRPTVSYLTLAQIADSSDLDGADLIRSLEDAITQILDPGQEEAFLEVVRSKEDPWSFQDLNDLCGWLTEAQVGRPLPQRSPSTSGDETTGTTSTDDSSSELAAASAT